MCIVFIIIRDKGIAVLVDFGAVELPELAKLFLWSVSVYFFFAGKGRRGNEGEGVLDTLMSEVVIRRLR